MYAIYWFKGGLLNQSKMTTQVASAKMIFIYQQLHFSQI